MSAINPTNHPDALRFTDSEFVRKDNRSNVSAVDSALRWTSLYLLDLLASTLGVVVVTGFFLNVILKPIEPIIGRTRLFSVARGPYYVFPLILALLAGYIGNVRFKGNQRYWVWVLPALYLAINLILWKNSSVLLSNHWQAALNHFFAGEPPYFPEQGITVPVYTSVAYSMGALLETWKRSKQASAKGTPGSEDTMSSCCSSL